LKFVSEEATFATSEVSAFSDLISEALGELACGCGSAGDG